MSKALTRLHEFVFHTKRKAAEKAEKEARWQAMSLEQKWLYAADAWDSVTRKFGGRP